MVVNGAGRSVRNGGEVPGDGGRVLGKVLAMHQHGAFESQINKVEQCRKAFAAMPSVENSRAYFVSSKFAVIKQAEVVFKTGVRPDVQVCRHYTDLSIFSCSRSSGDDLDSLPDLFIYMRAKGDQ